MLDTLVTTATGALSATVGVLVGSIVSHRAQDSRWLRDRQLAVHEEVLSHYAKFTMVINRAHADGRGWDYDWGEWSAALIRASLVAPAEAATEIENFAQDVNVFPAQAARDRNPTRDPLRTQEFAQANLIAAKAQVRVVNAIRRSLSKDQSELPFWRGGSLAGPRDDT